MKIHQSLHEIDVYKTTSSYRRENDQTTISKIAKNTYKEKLRNLNVPHKSISW